MIDEKGEDKLSDHVLYERSGAIVTLTLNLPKVRNAISDPEMISSILAALARLEADAEARVAILTGAGSSFSSGGDIKKMRDGGSIVDKSPPVTRINYKQGIQRIPLAFEELEKPVIAAVNGPAIGAGCDLACMCDIRIAGRSARFAESFVKLGIVAGDGGAWLLPRVVGFSKACEMALTGDVLSAEEALACGLVSKIVPDETLLDAAREMAGRIAANPPHGVRMTKRLLRRAQSLSLAESLEMAAAMQALAHVTADHHEALSAMIEKRPPSFDWK